MKSRVELPVALADAILQAARAASPRECCGLLEGRREDGAFRIMGLHPAHNLSPDAARFEIDVRDQFAAQKSARANGAAIVGCYHSHPGGRAHPSAADRAGVGEDDFLWLISGTDGLNAFVYRGGDFVSITGADWVTSSE